MDITLVLTATTAKTGWSAQDLEQLLGMACAVLGAFCMSFGAYLQQKGVANVARLTGSGRSELTFTQLRRLLSQRDWVFGLLTLGLALLLQLCALSLAPLIVVQPLGVVALVITAALTAHGTHTRLNRRSIWAIVMCVVGVGTFVTIASFIATERPVTEADLTIILVVLTGILTVFGVVFFAMKKPLNSLFYIVGAGVLYGFVATLTKSVINRIQHGDFGWLTALSLVGLAAAMGIGAYFVQNAYAAGPPDLVIAGLTVIDPLVAVTIGIVVLDEAAGAPLWAGIAFIVVAVVAIIGVFQLAKFHPSNADTAQQT